MAAKASKMTFKTQFNRSHLYTHLPHYLLQDVINCEHHSSPPLAQSSSKPCWFLAALCSHTQQTLSTEVFMTRLVTTLLLQLSQLCSPATVSENRLGEEARAEPDSNLEPGGFRQNPEPNIPAPTGMIQLI